MHALIGKIEIHYGFISSDHLPLTVHLNVPIDHSDLEDTDAADHCMTKIKWDKLSQSDLMAYKKQTELALKSIKFDWHFVMTLNVQIPVISQP